MNTYPMLSQNYHIHITINIHGILFNMPQTSDRKRAINKAEYELSCLQKAAVHHELLLDEKIHLKINIITYFDRSVFIHSPFSAYHL
jgi:hypothetical protein